MAISNGRDYLYLIWHDKVSKKQYIVGTLSKNGKYEFEYNEEVDLAIKNGFTLLTAFPKREKYECETLFPAFLSRLPDKKRSDIANILNKYGLAEYDAYQLLKRSGAKLPIDDIYFIDPIFDINDKFERTFPIAGSRYYMNCNNGNNCAKNCDLKIGDKLSLELEPENERDSNAVKILYNDKILGYIPRYYSENVTRIIKENKKYKCIVQEINLNDDDCQNCIIIKLFS